MIASLPWALPLFGGDWELERRGFFGLIAATLICFLVGYVLRRCGRNAQLVFLRKESLAIVGFAWLLAALLGTLPYLFSGTKVSEHQPMTFADAIFESQSGFSTCGATVLTELENPAVIPRSILFWRGTTHFLGGLGFMTLFVVFLTQGSGGKTMLRIEQTKLSSTTLQGKIRELAYIVFVLYLVLNVIATIILRALGLSLYDALFHSFSAISTGGFSTHNLSVGHFTATMAQGPAIEVVIMVFMILGGTNFALLYWLGRGRPSVMLRDREWRAYIGILLAATILIFVSGMIAKDFHPFATPGAAPGAAAVESMTQLSPLAALRTVAFQVTSIMTTTGFAVGQYELWNPLALLIFLMLMFAGGCAGSTAGGVKLVRLLLLGKAFRSELEHSFRPNVVRTIDLGGEPVDRDVVSNVFAFLLMFCGSVVLLTMILLIIEPNSMWMTESHDLGDKLLDLFSTSLATLSNTGPGLGVIGAKETYSQFTDVSKVILSFAMLLGRLEIMTLLVLFMPSFWRNR